MSAGMGYGKIYESLYTGSMIGSGALAFALMGYVIANMHPASRECESPMVVELNPKLLAAVLGEKIGDVEDTIEFLCAPDASSRSPEEEGRRLVREGQFLYRVVNGRKYREMRDAEIRKEQNKMAQRAWRARQRQKEEDGRELDGEAEYVKAAGRGAKDDELDGIVEKHLPMRKRKHEKE